MCMCLHVLPHAAARPLRVRSQDGGLDDPLEVERRLVEQGDLLATPACHAGLQPGGTGLQARACGAAAAGAAGAAGAAAAGEAWGCRLAERDG